MVLAEVTRALRRDQLGTLDSRLLTRNILNVTVRMRRIRSTRTIIAAMKTMTVTAATVIAHEKTIATDITAAARASATIRRMATTAFLVLPRSQQEVSAPPQHSSALTEKRERRRNEIGKREKSKIGSASRLASANLRDLANTTTAENVRALRNPRDAAVEALPAKTIRQLSASETHTPKQTGVSASPLKVQVKDRKLEMLLEMLPVSLLSLSPRMKRLAHNLDTKTPWIAMLTVRMMLSLRRLCHHQRPTLMRTTVAVWNKCNESLVLQLPNTTRTRTLTVKDVAESARFARPSVWDARQMASTTRLCPQDLHLVACELASRMMLLKLPAKAHGHRRLRTMDSNKSSDVAPAY